MNKELLVTTVIILGVVWAEAETCKSCGTECMSACGTKHFRSCCFNYYKKRSYPPEPSKVSLDPSLRLELWLARTRYPYFQPQKVFSEDSVDVMESDGGREGFK